MPSSLRSGNPFPFFILAADTQGESSSGDEAALPVALRRDPAYSLSRRENQSIASTRSGQRMATPPGKRGVGTEAMTSNRSA